MARQVIGAPAWVWPRGLNPEITATTAKASNCRVFGFPTGVPRDTKRGLFFLSFPTSRSRRPGTAPSAECPLHVILRLQPIHDRKTNSSNPIWTTLKKDAPARTLKLSWPERWKDYAPAGSFRTNCWGTREAAFSSMSHRVLVRPAGPAAGTWTGLAPAKAKPTAPALSSPATTIQIS